MASTPSQSCSGCEVLPVRLPETGTLYIAPPLAHTSGLLKRALLQMGLEVTETIGGTLAVEVVAHHLSTIADTVTSNLTAPEIEATSALMMPRGATPTIPDFLRARPLTRLFAQVRGEWLSTLLAEDRLVTHFQPIVQSDDPASVFAYECLTRGIDNQGNLIYPNRLYPTATESGLLFHLDRATRIRAIRTAAEHGLRGQIFINFSPASIYNPAFCLRSTARVATDACVDPERVVFEVVETENVHDIEHLLAILAVYRDAGFKIALDDLGAGYSSLNLLHRLRPDFVKLDMELVRDVERDPIKATIAAKLLETASLIGIPSIAEGVETIAEWEWLRDHGAIYQQGYLFARPASRAPIPVSPRIATLAASA